MGTHAIVLNHDIYAVRDVVQAEFLRRASELGLYCYLNREWTTDDDYVVDPGSLIAEWRTDSQTQRLVNLDGVLIHFTRNKAGLVEFEAAAENANQAQLAYEKISKTLTRRPDKDNRVNVRFWTLNKNNPHSVVREIDAVPLDSVRHNYSSKALSALAHMTSPDFVPGKGGQLLLWHGTPGTGKTWALRSVALSWKPWANIEYIVDPEQFFGEAHYLVKVLLGSEDEDEGADAKWRLLIFEDTGEMLTRDAKTRVGQGLSRLLNTVDGFIGQGLKVLSLITTNEEIVSLHEAVSRPGRCAVQIAFDKLSAAESSRWAEINGVARPINRAHTLAELYALRDGYQVTETSSTTMGFRGAA